MEPFDVHGSAMERGDDDREVHSLAEGVFLVRDQAALFFSKAKKLGNGVLEERFGDVLFVEGEVVLEVVSDGFFVLFITFTGEALDQATVGDGFAGEAGQFGDRFATVGDSDEMSAANEEPHGDFHAAQDAGPTGLDGKVLGMQTAVENKDR